MAITSVIVVGEVAHGTPRALTDPMGVWYGTAAVTGDASGGNVSAQFVPQQPNVTPLLPDLRQRYCYVCDGVSVVALNADPGNVAARLFTNDAAIGGAAPMQLAQARDALDFGGGFFLPDGDLLPEGAKRFALFSVLFPAGSTTVMVELRIQTNTLNNLTRFRAFGRYWDRAVINVPGFPNILTRDD